MTKSLKPIVQQGQAARAGGLAREACPYSEIDATERGAWMEGFGDDPEVDDDAD